MMDKEHRRILKLEHGMLSKVKLDDLRPFLRKYRIFNKYMWADVKTTKAMLDELPHRGPIAFRNLIEVLKEAEYYEEANQLERHTLAKKVDKNLYYSISTKPLGHCLIINNVEFNGLKKDRPGSDVDATNLCDILETIGFKVTVVRNNEAGEMHDQLQEFSRRNFTNVHSVIIIILSHGEQLNNKDVIYGTDGNYLFKSDIWNMFNNKRCPQLWNKPRVFFFICCRGRDFNYEVQVCSPNESIDNCGVIPTSFNNCGVIPTSCDNCGGIPTLKDILLVHSTLPEQVSVNDDKKGSFFCQEFIIILKEHFHRHDLGTMINLVNTKLEKRKSKLFQNIQLAHFEAVGGTKKFMFCKTCS